MKPTPGLRPIGQCRNMVLEGDREVWKGRPSLLTTHTHLATQEMSPGCRPGSGTHSAQTVSGTPIESTVGGHSQKCTQCGHPSGAREGLHSLLLPPLSFIHLCPNESSDLKNTYLHIDFFYFCKKRNQFATFWKRKCRLRSTEPMPQGPYFVEI